MSKPILLLAKYQTGQSMVEYIVVTFFSVMLLLAPLYDPDDDYGRHASLEGDTTFEGFKYANPGADDSDIPQRMNSIEVVQAVIQDNYKGYSYAVSLSEYPDYLPAEDLADSINDLTDSLNSLNDIQEDTISLVEDNIPPSLDSLEFPEFPPEIEISSDFLDPTQYIF